MNLTMAQRLVDRRKNAGLSQEALADKLGVSRQAVSKWERSESSPDTDNLIALAALYSVSLDELLYGEPHNEHAAPVKTEATANEAPSSSEYAEYEPSSANNGIGVSDTAYSSESDRAPASEKDTSENTSQSDGTSRNDSSDKPTVNISWREGIHVIDPNKGEEVHVGWNGIHVTNKRKNEEVLVGPGGVHVDTPDDGGHSVHTNADGTVDVDGETFNSWKEARDKLDHRDGRFHSAASRAWNKFPFPAVILLVYIALGVIYGSWGTGLFLVFTIPIFYAIGNFIDSPHLSKLIGGIYAPGVLAWFFYLWLCLDQPSPGFVMLLTIPVVESLLHWSRKQRRRHKRMQ